LALPAGSANLQMDLAIIAEAFVVVVVGGMGSLPGAFLAALLIGVLQSLGILFVPQGALVLIFVVMAVVLALRPQGLLGRAQAPARGAGEAPLLLPAGRGLRIAGTALLAIAAAAPLVVPPYAVSVLTEMAVFALFAASLHLLMGPGGMISFGHAAWFGLGAYGAAIAVHALGVPMPAGLLLGLALAGATALLVGAFVVRLTGVYLAMLTMAFAQIAWAFVFLATELTGGDNGVLGVRPEPWARDPATFFWLALALAVAGVLALRALAWTPFGFALRAARDSELRAAAIGLPVARLRWTAFAIGGAAAGLAGALYAYSKGSVFPTYISIPKSVDALIMVLLGGVHTLSGPVIGAIAYTGLYDALLRATDLWRLALGLIIIALVLAFPDGLAGAARRLLPGRAH
jgi:branched-chain amino acid transport system permease protein